MEPSERGPLAPGAVAAPPGSCCSRWRRRRSRRGGSGAPRRRFPAIRGRRGGGGDSTGDSSARRGPEQSNSGGRRAEAPHHRGPRAERLRARPRPGEGREPQRRGAPGGGWRSARPRRTPGRHAPTPLPRARAGAGGSGRDAEAHPLGRVRRDRSGARGHCSASRSLAASKSRLCRRAHSRAPRLVPTRVLAGAGLGTPVSDKILGNRRGLHTGMPGGAEGRAVHMLVKPECKSLLGDPQTRCLFFLFNGLRAGGARGIAWTFLAQPGGPAAREASQPR